MSMLTVRGTWPLSLSSVAAAIGGGPAVLSTEITAEERSERFNCGSIAWAATRKVPGLLKVTLTDEPEKQHQPLVPTPVTHRSQYNGPSSGSPTGKFTVTVSP